MKRFSLTIICFLILSLLLFAIADCDRITPEKLVLQLALMEKVI